MVIREAQECPGAGMRMFPGIRAHTTVAGCSHRTSAPLPPLHPCPPSEPRQQRYWERQHPEEARPECKRPSCQQFRLSYLFLPLLPRIGGWESAGHFGLRTKASWAQGTVLLLPCC